MKNPPAVLEAVPYYPEADSFEFHKTLSRLLHVCGTRKLLILFTCLATVGLTVAYLRIWPPVYVAEVALVGESDKDRSRENFYQGWAVFRQDQLTDEVRMITMAPVLQETVQKLQLGDDEVYRSFFSHIGYLWTTSSIGKTYRRMKEWIFPPVRGAYDPTPEEVAAARILLDFKSGVSLERVMETNIGRLVVRGPTPRVAEIANTLVQVYFDQRRQRHIREADAAYAALSVELQRTHADLSALEERMRAYYAQNELLLTFEKDKIEIGQLQALKAAIIDLTTQIAGNEETLRQLEQDLGSESKEVVASRLLQANPIRDGLSDKLANLQLLRRQTLIAYKANSPEVQDLDRQIAVLSEQLAREPDRKLRQTTVVLSSRFEELRGRAATLRADLAGQRSTLAAKQAAHAEMLETLKTLPEKMRAVHDMSRDHQALEKKLAAIHEKLMMAAVSRTTALTALPTIRVGEPAAAPSEAVWPRSKLLLAGAVAVGLLAGALLALLLDLMYGRVHRFRITGSSHHVPLYALVRRDSAFVRQLFALPGPPARPGAPRLT